MADAPEDYDVLIVGAGINGAGLFRDLCEQGLRCMIIDKGDFGSGTSAAPSRLIHGGLKYLETGELRLVAESTYERNLLLRNASHLVRPLPTIIPVFSWVRGVGAAIQTLLGSTTAPRSRGALLVKIGLQLYDLYGARARQMPRHRMLTRSRALRQVPALTPRIVAAGTYYDAAVTAPERLVLELIDEGLRASPGSAALNWTALTGTDGATVEIAPPERERVRLHPQIVVNAAGPWIDRVNKLLGAETQLIGGTKGSHILLDHPELLRQLDGRMIYFEGNDGRILLVFPYLGKALVGSTDIPADNPDALSCDPEETAYFIRSLSELLPGLRFDTSQIVYSYAGIRPLPNMTGTAPGLISRDHSAPVTEPTADRPYPIVSLVGGKWTTFRAFAAEVADLLLDRLGRPRRVSTDSLPIGGGRGMPSALDARQAWLSEVVGASGTSRVRIETLLDRYGTTARDVALHEGPDPVYLPGCADTTVAEIDRIARHEHVCHLEDILLRRTQLAVTGALTRATVEQVCKTTAAALRWDDKRIATEIAAAHQTLARRHGVVLKSETEAP